MKRIITSISVAIVVLTGLQALPVSPDLKFETPEEKGTVEKENIRRKKHDNLSPIEAFIHQHPVQLKLSTHQQSIPLRGLFTGHTFPSGSSQSIPIYSPIEILQIPRHAIIQSNDNYFQSVNVPQPQLIKIPDFTPTVSSGTFDPSQPTQIIFQRVPVVVEIIDKSTNSQKEINPLITDSEKSSSVISSSNSEQKTARSNLENINSNSPTKDESSQKNNIDVHSNDPKDIISLSSKVQNVVLEKPDSFPETALTPSDLVEEGKNISIGDTSVSPMKLEKLETTDNQEAAHDIANLEDSLYNPSDGTNVNGENLTHEETLEEIIDKILFEFENLPSSIDSNNKHKKFQQVAKEEQQTTNLKLSPPTEDLPNTFPPSEIKASQSPIEHFMKFVIEPPKIGNFGMKMFPENQNEKQTKNTKTIESDNSIPSGKSINITPFSISSNPRSINSISKSIFNADRPQGMSIIDKLPEVLHQTTKNDMLSTDEIFALLDQEIDKNMSQPNGITVLNEPLNSEFTTTLSVLAHNQGKHFNVVNDSLAQENKFREDSFSAGKSLASQSEKVDTLKENEEALIVFPDEEISHLDPIVEMSPVSKEIGQQFETNGELDNKFPTLKKGKEMLDSLVLSPEELFARTEETTTLSSKGKLDDELADLLTEIVAEAVREFLVNKKVEAVPTKMIEIQKEEDTIALNVTETEKTQFNEPSSADLDFSADLNGKNSQVKNNFLKKSAEFSQTNENFTISEKLKNQLLDAGNSSSLISLPISTFDESNRLDRKLISDSFSVSQQLVTHISSDSPSQTHPKDEFLTSISTEKITISDFAENETTEPTILEHAMKKGFKEADSQFPMGLLETDLLSETEFQINNFEEISHLDLETPSSDDVNTKESPLLNSANNAIIEAPSLQLNQMPGLNLDKKKEVVEPISLTTEPEMEAKLGDIILDYLNETTTFSNLDTEIQNKEFFTTTMNVVEESDIFSEIENIFTDIDPTKELELPIMTIENEPSNLFSSSQLITTETNYITTTEATFQLDQYTDEETNFTVKKKSDNVIFLHDELSMQTESPSLSTDSEPFWELFTETIMSPKIDTEEIRVKDNVNYSEVETLPTIGKINLNDAGKNLAGIFHEETLHIDDQDDQNKENAVPDHAHMIVLVDEEMLSSKLNDTIGTSITVTKDDTESFINTSHIFNANTAKDTTENEENESATEETLPNLNKSGMALSENRELKTSRKIDEMDLSLFFFNRIIKSEEQSKKNTNTIEEIAAKETPNENDKEINIAIVDDESTVKEFLPNKNIQMKTNLTINDNVGKEVKEERLSNILNPSGTFIHSNFKVIEAPNLNPNQRLEFQPPATILQPIIPTTTSNNNDNRDKTQLENDNDFEQIKEDTDPSTRDAMSQDLKLLFKFKLSTTGSKNDNITHPGSQSSKVLVPKIVPFFHKVEYEATTSTADFANETIREHLDRPTEQKKHIETDVVLLTNFQATPDIDLEIIGSNIKVTDDKEFSGGDSQTPEFHNNADTKGDIIIGHTFEKNSEIKKTVIFPEQESAHLSHQNEEDLQPVNVTLENKNLNSSFIASDELHQIKANLKNTVQEKKQFVDDPELSTSSPEKTNRESTIMKEDNLSNTDNDLKDSKDPTMDGFNKQGSHHKISDITVTDATKNLPFDMQEEIIPVDQSTDEAKQSSILNLIDSFKNTSGEQVDIRLPIDTIPMRGFQPKKNEVQNTDLPTSSNSNLSLADLAPLSTKKSNNTNERVEVTVVSSRKSVSFQDPTFRRRPNLFRRPKLNRAHQNILSKAPNEAAIKPNNINNEKNLSLVIKKEETKNLETIIAKKENFEAETSKAEISQGRSIIDRLLNELKLVKRDSSFWNNNNNKSSTVDQMIKVFEKTSDLGEAQMKGFIENLKKITKTFFQQKTDTEEPTPKVAREIAGGGQSELNNIMNIYNNNSKLKSEKLDESINNFYNATNLSKNLTFPLLEMLEKEFSVKEENKLRSKKDKIQRIPEVMEEQLLPLTKLFKMHSVEVNDQELLLLTSDKIKNKAESNEILVNTTTNFLHPKHNMNPINSSDYLTESVQNKIVQRVHKPIKPSLLLSVSHVQSGRSLFPTSLKYEDEFQPIKVIEPQKKKSITNYQIIDKF